VGPDTLAQLVEVAGDNRNGRVFNRGGRSLRTSILKANPWAIADADQDLMPYLVGETIIPLVSDGSSVCVPCTASGGLGAVTTQWPIAQRFLNFQLLGEFHSVEILSDVVRARSEKRSLDLSIFLNDERSGQTYLSGQSASRALGAQPEYILWPTPTVGGYFFQFRGPDPGGLAGCAPDAPQHYNAELWQVHQWQPNTTVMNLHIAIWWRSGQLCFALANSDGWPECFSKCTPTWNDIYQSILSALTAAGIIFFIAAALATLLATLIYGSLGVLALV